MPAFARYPIACCLVLLLAGCARSEDSTKVAATVGGTPITVAELGDRYAHHVLQAGLQRDDSRLRRDVLDGLVHRRLLIRSAHDEGIARTAEYAAEREVAQRRLLVQRYAQRTLYDTLQVRDADLRDLFGRANTQITARHLYARTRAEAEALRARLLTGETFEALAAEVFADPKLAQNGGLVGTFSFDDMDPAFEEAAFHLPVGEISEPVRTAMGYSIVRVEDRFTTPLLTETAFAQKKDQFRQYARKRARTEARFTHSRVLLDALRLEFDQGGVAALSAAARGEVGEASLVETTLQERPLVRFGPDDARTMWTVGDVEDRARFATERQLDAVDSPDALREFVEGLVVQQEMVRRAQSLGLDREASYAEAVENALDAWVFERAKDDLRREVRVPDDSVRAHFAAHGAGYRTPERVRVQEILVASKEEADRLRRQLDGGASFEALARAHTLRPGARAAGGDLGPLGRDDLGVLAGPVFEAAPGTTLGPLEVADRYAVLRVGARVAPRPQTFDEARPRIEEALELHFARAALERRLQDLRARYRVVLHEDAIRSVRLFS